MSPPKSKESYGAIYVAFGEVYFLQALHSVSTLRIHNPELPVVVLHNMPGAFSLPERIGPDRCEFRRIDAPNSRNRDFKSSFHKHSPFERTIFLDCDTEIKRDLSLGFKFLDHADIAIRPEPAPFAMSVTERDPEEAERLTLDFGEFNTGVIFTSGNAAATKLLDAWHAHVLTNNKRDQKHFVRAVASCREATIWPLAAAWNYMRYDVRTHARASLLRSDPYIWHYMDYSYSRSALAGVWAIAQEIDMLHHVRNWPYVKKDVIRPFMTRYAFMKTIDRIRAFPRSVIKSMS